MDELQQTGMLDELRKDSERKIDPYEPPCSTVSVVSLGAERHLLLWSFHHLFLDGWSTAIFIRDVLSRYRAMSLGISFRAPNKPSFKEYLNGRTVDDKASEIYWREQLSGFQGNPKLESDQQPGSQVSGTWKTKISLDQEVVRRLRQLIRSQNLTVYSIASACWAIITGEIAGKSDVVFGATASGRNLPIDGMQNLVGLFANVVPVRIQTRPGPVSLRDWLTEIRDNQFDAQLHEHRTLSEIQSWCDLQADGVLCQTLLVVENFPLKLGEYESDSLSLFEYRSGATSNFPITCYVISGEEWEITIELDSHTGQPEQSGIIAEHFTQIVQRLSESSPDMPLQSFYDSLEFRRLSELLRVNRGKHFKRQANVDLHLVQLDETALQMTSIWEEVLGLSSIDVDENFFEIGGMSLAAVRLLSRVEEAFGTRLAPTVLIENPTIAELARLVASGKEPGNGTLVRFNQQETGDPVVCLQVGGGHATYYRFHAKQFCDHTVVGLQPRGLEGGTPIGNFRELAASFIEQLDQVFGSRRYFLVGYCMGGAVGLEMARQLESANRPPRLLAIIDSGPKWLIKRKRWRDFRAEGHSTFKASSKLAVYHVKNLLRPAWHVVNHLRHRYFANAVQRREYFRRRVHRYCQNAFFAYQPKPTSVPIKLIRSTQFLAMPDRDFHLGWRDLAKTDFSVEVVDTDHEKILNDPAVSKVARIIRGHIAQLG